MKHTWTYWFSVAWLWIFFAWLWIFFIDQFRDTLAENLDEYTFPTWVVVGLTVAMVYGWYILTRGAIEALNEKKNV